MYCSGPKLAAKEFMGTPALSKIHQILSGMIGTTCLVLAMVHN